ncbi:MAG: DUF3427 domain-containing protein, partial [Pararheinheimera sp.]|nr:DUF3427 domain-containing protein [Rheinheimera sp.]
FVGNSRAEYDFSNKFRALIGKTNKAISDEIKQGFPHAPLGCRIELSKITQEIVLNNIRQATLTNNRLVGLIRQYPHNFELPLTLGNFLKLHPHIGIRDLYQRGGWSELVSRSFDEVREKDTDDVLVEVYKRAIKLRILACDDYHYLVFLKKLVSHHFVVESSQNQRLALMCYYDFWQKPGPAVGFETLEQSLQALNCPSLRNELLDVLEWQIAQTKHEQLALAGLPDVPLRLHARYTREQILTGFGAITFERQPPAREGVYVIQNQNIELLFVTLNKSEKQFSPTTMYHDYAINESLFHWQSQNSARPDRGRGLDYLQHKMTGKRIFLFVREQTDDEYGHTMGFVNYGEVEYVSHTGSQPMSITWKLQSPMPSFMWQQAAKLAVG